MKAWTLPLLLVVMLTACHYVYKNPVPQLKESEMNQMAGCRKLGVISGNADAGDVSAYDATYRMIADIKSRAARMGATHIVWIYQGKLSATAAAFQCPQE